MQKPIINWYMIKDGSENPAKDEFLGNVKPGERVELVFNIWNNRFGQEATYTAKNPKIRIQFDKIENSFMLNDMVVSIDGSAQELSIVDDVGTVMIPKDLTGYDITASEAQRANNSITLSVNIFIRNNVEESLKSLNLDFKYEIVEEG